MYYLYNRECKEKLKGQSPKGEKMKRLYNNVPLQSVLYTVGGLQKIKIVDIDSIRWKDYANRVVIYEGLEKDFLYCNFDAFGLSHYKVEYASVHGIDVEDEVLVFTICLTSCCVEMSILFHPFCVI